jgi:hypothetical protein
MIFVIRSYITSYLLKMPPDQAHKLISADQKIETVTVAIQSTLSQIRYTWVLTVIGQAVGWGLGLTVHCEQCDELMPPLCQPKDSPAISNDTDN